MKYFENVIKYVLAAFMLAITCLTTYQIVMRYVFNNASSWSEELSRFLFVWASFVAAGIGIKEHIHIGIDVIVNLLPEKIQEGIRILVHGVIAAFGGWLAWSCLGLMRGTARQYSSALRYPKSWLYGSVLVLGILCVVYGIHEIVMIIRGKRVKEV